MYSTLYPCTPQHTLYLNHIPYHAVPVSTESKADPIKHLRNRALLLQIPLCEEDVLDTCCPPSRVEDAKQLQDNVAEVFGESEEEALEEASGEEEEDMRLTCRATVNNRETNLGLVGVAMWVSELVSILYYY